MELYDKLLDLNILKKAFDNCKKGVSWKSSVQRFEANLILNLNKLKRELENGSYTQNDFHQFTICERGKVRNIKSLTIRDRVLQRTLCDEILFPTLSKYFIYDNGASMKNKGISFSRERLKVHLQKYYRQYGNEGYVLTIDFSKYFDNINHDKLLEKIKEKISDERVNTLVEQIIRSFGDGNSVGIGSQISQVAGIFFPTEIDNYCKVVKGCKYYARYMDDTYIIHPSKDFLKHLLSEITIICDRLGIKINTKKTQIIKLSQGFTFLKGRYNLTNTGKIVIRPDKSTFKREYRKLKKFKKLTDEYKMDLREIEAQYKSWKGNLRQFNCNRKITNFDNKFRELFNGREF